MLYGIGLLECPRWTIVVFQGGGDGRGYRNMYLKRTPLVCVQVAIALSMERSGLTKKSGTADYRMIKFELFYHKRVKSS